MRVRVVDALLDVSVKETKNCVATTHMRFVLSENISGVLMAVSSRL